MRRPLTLAATMRGEGPPDGGFTRAEWDAMHLGSIQVSRECQQRAAARENVLRAAVGWERNHNNGEGV